MAVRIKDIAHDLGLSSMAVSKALRGHADIGEETIRRVRKRAEELNYRVDMVARSMVTGRSFLVGLVVPDLMQSFFTEVAVALANALGQDGYHVVIAHTNEDPAEEIAQISALESRRVDGLIIASTQRDGTHLGHVRTPFVLIDRLVPGLDVSWVGVDDEQIAQFATGHLFDQGCRRIAHLRGPNLSTSEGRLAGYHKAIIAHGLPFDETLTCWSGHEEAGGRRAMAELLAHPAPPDGVVCFNDPVAIGAMHAILDAGLRVPDDIAVIGAANMRYSDALRISLSTIDQAAAKTGEDAARLLLALMTADTVTANPTRIVQPARLIARASSARQ